MGEQEKDVPEPRVFIQLFLIKQGDKYIFTYSYDILYTKYKSSLSVATSFKNLNLTQGGPTRCKPE